MLKSAPHLQVILAIFPPMTLLSSLLQSSDRSKGHNRATATQGTIFDIVLSGDSANQALADKMPEAALHYSLL